jgi:hypothetical protein
MKAPLVVIWMLLLRDYSRRGIASKVLGVTFELLEIIVAAPRANVERDTCLGLIKLQGRAGTWPQY